jgi:hypothetical protein
LPGAAAPCSLAPGEGTGRTPLKPVSECMLLDGWEPLVTYPWGLVLTASYGSGHCSGMPSGPPCPSGSAAPLIAKALPHMLPPSVFRPVEEEVTSDSTP